MQIWSQVLWLIVNCIKVWPFATPKVIQGDDMEETVGEMC